MPLFHVRSDRSRPVAFRSFPVPACAPTVRARRQERQVQGGGSEELGSRHWVRPWREGDGRRFYANLLAPHAASL
ncbi:hypothetical protein ZEAMMB73_Zm00001d042935 [Zea mays]|uniref:Uncharacterized protein n=1 Tax=Zea mays TaxID=4577 RepID=A0A1D6N7K7_MAIZE|nr:hypothetical protein ZEAMMB73_Zm00001d042935 [Zea mays]